jgi:hypothetical protein
VRKKFTADGGVLSPTKKAFLTTVLSDVMEGQMYEPKLRNRAAELLLQATPQSTPTAPNVVPARSARNLDENIALSLPTRVSRRRASLPPLQDPKASHYSRQSIRSAPRGGMWETMLSGILNTAPPSRELLDSQKSYLVSNPERYGFPERVVRLVHKFIVEEWFWLKYLFAGIAVMLALLFLAPIIAL